MRYWSLTLRDVKKALYHHAKHVKNVVIHTYTVRIFIWFIVNFASL